MLHVSLADGSVLTLDLGSEDGRKEWSTRTADHSFLRSVRALSLVIPGGQRADLPLPRRFRGVTFAAELVRDRGGVPVAERVSAMADDVVLSLTVYLNGRSGRFRVDLDRRGRSRFRPSFERSSEPDPRE